MVRAHLGAQVHNLRAVRNAPRRRVKLHWQSVSRCLDRYGRMVVPYTFLLAMIFIFNLELTDDYEINDLGRESSTGDASFTGVPHGRCPHACALAGGHRCSAHHSETRWVCASAQGSGRMVPSSRVLGGCSSRWRW
jgi:hypothetical protein